MIVKVVVGNVGEDGTCKLKPRDTLLINSV